VLKLGIPSKGRMMSQTFRWFMNRGIYMRRLGDERTYSAHIDGIDEVSLVMLSAGEIPRELAAGRLHFGVTGTDLVYEKLPCRESHVESVIELGFGRASLVLAVPDFWIDVDTLDDLDDVAADFRARSGMRLRIATGYPLLVREFLNKAGVADYALVDSQGATEGTIKNEVAEVIADITSTGETLRANSLRILSDGLILDSQATLWRSCVAHFDRGETTVASDFLSRLKI